MDLTCEQAAGSAGEAAARDEHHARWAFVTGWHAAADVEGATTGGAATKKHLFATFFSIISARFQISAK